MPDLLQGFWVNVRLFMLAEVLVLIFAMGVAIIRSVPGPAFFPLRCMNPP